MLFLALPNNVDFAEWQEEEQKKWNKLIMATQLSRRSHKLLSVPFDIQSWSEIVFANQLLI